MIILRENNFSVSEKDLIREIKKEFPGFTISKPATEYFKTLGKLGVIAGDMYALDLDAIIMMSKMLPSITDNGKSRLIVASSSDCNEFICLEKDGYGTIWDNTGGKANLKFVCVHSEPTIQKAIEEYARAINGVTNIVPAKSKPHKVNNKKKNTLFTILGIIGLLGLSAGINYLIDSI